MSTEQIIEALKSTGVPFKEDYAVPANGVTLPLPYLVARMKHTSEADDAGRVGVVWTDWRVALFDKKRNFALECKVQNAIHGCGVPEVEVLRFPDGTPYETDFNFRTVERR